MEKSKWRVDDGDKTSDFATTIAKIARGEYIPVKKTYPAFRKMINDPPSNPSTFSKNENYAYDAHYKLSIANKSTTSSNGKNSFSEEPRFKKYSTSPTKPETFSEPSVQYFGRTRKINIFAPVKALFHPDSRAKKKEESSHVVYYDKPDLWRTKSSCGVIKPTSVMESTSRRELFDVMVPTVHESNLQKPRKRGTASTKIRPLIMVIESPSEAMQTAGSLQHIPTSPTVLTGRHIPSGTSCLVDLDEGSGTIAAPSMSSPDVRPRPLSRGASLIVDRAMTPVQKLRESKAGLPKLGFTFPKDSPIELDGNTVLYHRVVAPEGGEIVVPIMPRHKTQEFIPRGGTLAELHSSTRPRSPMDPYLRCLTPQRSPFAASRSTLDLQSSVGIDESSLQMTSRPNTVSSTYSNSYLSNSDAMPRGTFSASPIKPLSHCEWRPPVVPGKSALRRARDQKEQNAFMKKSQVFSSGSVSLPVSLMDIHGIQTSPSPYSSHM